MKFTPTSLPGVILIEPLHWREALRQALAAWERN